MNGNPRKEINSSGRMAVYGIKQTTRDMKVWQSLYKAIYAITDHEQRMRFLTEQVERITGLKNFGIYLNQMFTMDAFFLNEDRHTHNIAVLMNEEGKFDYCPIFDQGAGLLADTTMDYPLDTDVYELMKEVQAKTICSDFDEQLELSEQLYGGHITFSFTKEDVHDILVKADIYSLEERQRVENILFEQMRKHAYLFE